jgi:hypothetical protein
MPDVSLAPVQGSIRVARIRKIERFHIKPDRALLQFLSIDAISWEAIADRHSPFPKRLSERRAAGFDRSPKYAALPDNAPTNGAAPAPSFAATERGSTSRAALKTASASSNRPAWTTCAPAGCCAIRPSAATPSATAQRAALPISLHPVSPLIPSNFGFDILTKAR